MPILRKAFQIAQSGTPGKISLHLPVISRFKYHSIILNPSFFGEGFYNYVTLLSNNYTLLNNGLIIHCCNSNHVIDFMIIRFFFLIYQVRVTCNFLLISGPVFVEFPIDTLYPYPLVKKESGVKVRLQI